MAFGSNNEGEAPSFGIAVQTNNICCPGELTRVPTVGDV